MQCTSRPRAGSFFYRLNLSYYLASNPKSPERMPQNRHHGFNENFRRHYRLPEGYMNELEQKMLNRLAEPALKRGRRIWLRILTGAAAVGLVWLAVKPSLHPGGQDRAPYSDSLQVYAPASPAETDETIPDDIITDYLLMDEDELEI